ncbi:dihydropteroate synthase [Thermocatellispora tengchongensis]|uniref:dihydropteroate synthase n=1 Tax=Thermocatellispora tengchongensis TaxID=1073253 RepID=A0A840P066_9ACTN|nr:dihydropteroate synthase [Thermocatellispora tengchongensis]MBB5134594.1 dihydropteroate synthase [Thermocatellispora tengchongensis]
MNAAPHPTTPPARPGIGPLRVMGIVNATPDSFWPGSRYETAERAIAAGREMFRHGAWVVDVGGESTRPGAVPVPVEEELDRVVPVVAALAAHGRVSVDTRNPEVAEAAVAAGASIVNDVSGKLHALAAQLGVGYIGMHAHTVPVLRDAYPVYEDVCTEVASYLRTLATAARSEGVAEMWIDPGIGFGKTTEDNITLLRRLPELCALGVPVALGVSRKSFIGKVTGREVGDRLAGSLALIGPAWSAGVDLIRVHDVAETMDAIALLEAVWGDR